MEVSLISILKRRWRETRARKSFVASAREIGADFWEFLRESTPERKRLRYGDVEYDWEHQVNTTSATITTRGRLIAALSGAPYQPTEPGIFRRMIEELKIDYPEFTFIDLGSGKGRTLLMASLFPFRRIIGVELLPELNEIARMNIAGFNHPEQKSPTIESVCCDARDYAFPPEPLLVYLFNPLPEGALMAVIENLRKSLQDAPRQLRVLYHNPISEHVLKTSGFLRKLDGTFQYSIYSN